MLLYVCPCGHTYPLEQPRCPECGYDEDCVCCQLYGTPTKEVHDHVNLHIM